MGLIPRSSIWLKFHLNEGYLLNFDGNHIKITEI